MNKKMKESLFIEEREERCNWTRLRNGRIRISCRRKTISGKHIEKECIEPSMPFCPCCGKKYKLVMRFIY